MNTKIVSVSLLENYLTNQDADIAKQASEWFEMAQSGEASVLLHSVVLSSCAEKLATRFKRLIVSEALMKVIHLDNVIVPEKELMVVAIDIFGRQEKPFADAVTEAMLLKRPVPNM